MFKLKSVVQNQHITEVIFNIAKIPIFIKF